MRYLEIVRSFQSNWIYIAVAAIIGCFSSFHSPMLAGLAVGLAIFCWFRISKVIAPLVLLTSVLFFTMTEWRMPTPLNLTEKQYVTITSSYKQQGDRWAGFAKLPSGEKIYLSYQIQDENQAQAFSNRNWTGNVVEVILMPQPQPLRSHAYEFSFTDYLMSKGASGAFQATHFEVVGNREELSWKLAARVSQWRQTIHSAIVRRIPEALQDEILSLTIGDRSLGDQDTNRLYQKLGLSHLFAISGLHIALLTGAIYYLLLQLNVRLRTIYLLLLLLVPVYMLLAGGAPSVVRASLMVWIITLLLFFKKKVDPSDLLAIVLVLTISYFPFYLLQPGYQLSFLAVFSLIYSNQLLQTTSFWLSAFLTTVICQLAVLPIILLHFQQVSVISLLVNVLAIPLFTFVILPSSFFYAICAQLPFEWVPFITSYSYLREQLQVLFIWIAAIPFSVWTPPAINSIFLVVVVLVIFVFLLWERKAFISLLVVFILAVGWQAFPRVNSDATLSFLYVGQGDSTLIEFPYRKKTVLIDAGGVTQFAKEPWQQRNSYEIGRSIVTPYLRSKGITTIDIFILTHADADHTEGAEEILEDFLVKQVIVPKEITELEELAAVVEVAKKKNIPILELAEPLQISTAQATLYLLPVPGSYQGNDSSIVSVVDIYNVKTVLPGDLEEGGEGTMAAMHPEILADATVLKLGHHGSKTSTTESWLELLSPKLAIGSAGKDNRYGHPHISVLERLELAEIPYFGTHQKGTIALSITKEGTLQMKP